MRNHIDEVAFHAHNNKTTITFYHSDNTRKNYTIDSHLRLLKLRKVVDKHCSVVQINIMPFGVTAIFYDKRSL